MQAEVGELVIDRITTEGDDPFEEEIPKDFQQNQLIWLAEVGDGGIFALRIDRFAFAAGEHFGDSVLEISELVDGMEDSFAAKEDFDGDLADVVFVVIHYSI